MTVFNELEERAVGALEIGEANRYRVEVAGEHGPEADPAAGVECRFEVRDRGANVMNPLPAVREELGVEGLAFEELDELDLERAGPTQGDADAAVALAAPVVGAHDRQLEDAERPEERLVGPKCRVHVTHDETDLVDGWEVEVHGAQ